MRVVRGAMAGTALVVMTACSTGVSSAAHVAPVAAIPNHWEPLRASYLTTTACPRADSTCAASAAHQTGGAVLGPVKGSGLRVVGLLTRHSSTGSTVDDVDYYLARQDGATPVWVGAGAPRPASFQPLAGESVTIRGAAGFSYATDTENAHQLSLFWNEAGRGFDLLIDDDPSLPMPTVAEAVAIAKSLVLYRP